MLTDVLTPVVLQGRGLVERGGDYYEPGEYSRFQNLDLTPQGTLKKRLSAQGYKYNSFAGSTLDRIIGSYEENPVFVYYDPAIDMNFIRSTDELSVLSSLNNNYNTSFRDPVLATAGLDANHINRTIAIEGYFKYNNDQYVISNVSGWYEYVNTGINHISYQHKVVISKGAPLSTFDYFLSDLGLYSTNSLAFSYDPVDFRSADANKVVLRPFVTCFLFHKDRLLIAAEDTLYLSKATDPLTFTPSSGGAFFKFSNKRINKVVALGDMIYIIFDSSIAVLTYNTDPNVDGQVRIISDAVGGEDAAVYGDTIYVVRASDIHAIRGTNVTKVIDINARNMMVSTVPVIHSTLISTSSAAATYQVKCAAFNGELYIINRVVKKISSANINKSHLWFCGLNDDNFPAYKLNLETGTLTKLKYTADVDLPIGDLIYIPIQGREHDKIAFLSRTSTLAQVHAFYHSLGNRFRYGEASTDYYESFTSGYYGIDSFSSSDGSTFNTYPIPIAMTLLGIAPEHLRYMVNKFRSLQMQAALPLWRSSLATDPELELIVDAGRSVSSYSSLLGNLATILTPNTMTSRNDPDSGTSKSVGFGNVDTYRYGFNQRAKSVNITIRTRSSVIAKPGVWTDYTPNLGGENYVKQTFFELVDISLLWTPTRRGPNNNVNSYL